ncbi:MAG: hypothetical protein OXN17_06750 [Candidatus Poribacteria bacterium]|nr:hypothetical protein [Candidatus Poribacteria bacterium]MDE0506671.1 hypothetical protein [Candidatus Poribacteria bacterium]
MALYPSLLIPSNSIDVAVQAFDFVGNGLRAGADSYMMNQGMVKTV